jgi:hypothetical protein
VLGNQKQADANKAAAAARDADLRPILEAMRDQTYREIAQPLTDRGIKTPRRYPDPPGRGKISGKGFLILQLPPAKRLTIAARVATSSIRLRP